jgi:hypothetical protein
MNGRLVYGQRPIRWLPAVGLLLGVAIGGLTAVTRPGAASVGLVGLSLIPVAALILQRPARALTLIGALVYVAALIWAYRSHFSPIFAYSGLIDAAPGSSAILVTVVLAVIPAAWLPLSADRPSSIVLWALYLLGYVPTIVVPVFMKGVLGAVLPFDLALAGSMAMLSAILLLPPPRITVPRLSLGAFTRLLCTLGVLSALYIVAAFGIHPPPSLSNVYGTRSSYHAQLAGTTGGGYIVPWAGNAVYPILMALGLARRRPGLVILGVAGELLIYADTGLKEVAFGVALVPLVYSAISLRSRWFGVLASFATPAILVAAVHLSFITGQLSVSLARRVFATPGQVGYYYYEYFSLHQKDHLANSFLRWFVDHPYLKPPPLIIGSAYFPKESPNANAHIWADAFANFGFAGIVVFTLVCGVVLWAADGLGRHRDARVAGPMLAIAGLSLGSSGLFTTILTDGLAAGCVLMALMPPVPVSQAPRFREGDSHRRRVRYRIGPGGARLLTVLGSRAPPAPTEGPGHTL